jgi:hypothetical protein
MIYLSISTSRMILHFLGSGDPSRGAGPAMARPNGPTPYFYADNMLNTWRISGGYGENNRKHMETEKIDFTSKHSTDFCVL